MQFEVLIEEGKADESFQSGIAHFGDVFELHVIGYERDDLIGVFGGEPKASAEGFCHFGTEFGVAVEADAVSGLRSGAEGRRFADVVKKDAPSEVGGNTGGKRLEHHAGVNPDVAFRMKLGRLGNALESGDLRKDVGEQMRGLEKFETATSGAFGEELGEFFANAFGGDFVNSRGVPSNGDEGVGLDGVGKTSGEADGAEHTELVFGETDRWITDGADEAGVEIGATVDVVEDFAGIVAHEQAVDGEVATGDVFLGGGGVYDGIGVAAVGIANVFAKGSDLDLEAIAGNENDAEMGADADAAGEEGHNAVGSSVGGDVVIRGIAMQEKIANAAAHEQGDVTVALESGADGIGEFAGQHGGSIMQWREAEENGKDR